MLWTQEERINTVYEIGPMSQFPNCPLFPLFQHFNISAYLEYVQSTGLPYVQVLRGGEWW